MLVLLLAPTMAFAVEPVVGAIDVQDMRPADLTFSPATAPPQLKANITGYESGFGRISSQVEWAGGTFDNYTAASGNGVELRDISRDDFVRLPGGRPDASVWEWGENANVNGFGFLELNGYGSNDSYLQSYIRMRTDQAGFDLATRSSFTISTQIKMNSGWGNAHYLGLGWSAPQSGNQPTAFGIMLEETAGGTLARSMSIYLWSSAYGASGTSYEVYLGDTLDLALSIDDGAQELITASFTNVSGSFDLGQWYSGPLGSEEPWVPVIGVVEPFTSGSDENFQIDVNFFDLGMEWRAASGTYISPPISTGLDGGAYAQLVNFTTSNGLQNGIQQVSVSTAYEYAGPWSPFRPIEINTAIDEVVDGFVRFQIDMVRATNPSWPESVEVYSEYHTSVGAYWYEDIPSNDTSLTLNPTSWTADSTTLAPSGLLLSSAAAASGPVGVTASNFSWTTGAPYAFEGLVKVWISDAMNTSITGDPAMLLTGVRAHQGPTQVGYVGVARVCCSASPQPRLALVSNDGSQTTVQIGEHLGTSYVLIRFAMQDGTFRAWFLDQGNLNRGWVDLGSATLSVPAGSTATWRMGSVGAGASSQWAVVDWAALKLYDMVPALGDEWVTQDPTSFNEDLNTRAIVAISGPTLDIQVANYGRDTTVPVGAFTVNNGAPGATSLVVDLQMAATDRWGVAFYSASESLSFPEGWKPYPADGSANFLLSSGDGRKVIWTRFMDTHGLMSEPVNRSVILDTVDPSGALYLNDRLSTTSSPQVELTLLAFDEGGIDAALVSNSADLSGAVTIDMTDGGVAQTAITKVVPWTLSAGDGIKTVHVQYVDANGRTSSLPYYNASIRLDSTAPTVTATLLGTLSRDNTLYLNRTVATVRVSASDGSGVDSIEISPDNTFASARSYSAPGDLIYDLPPTSGARSLFIRATDVYGLTSAPVIRIDFIVDVSPPVGAITVNAAAEVTTSRTVQLTLNATDNIAVSEMQLSTSLYFIGSVWQPYAPTASIDLPSGDDLQKTVYVRYRDVNGRESQAYYDQISLDTTPPAGSVIINNGDVSTIDRNLNLQLESFDNFGGSLEMRIGTSPDLSAVTWRPFSENFRVDAGQDSGNVTIYYQIRDTNGLVSETYTDDIRVRPATCEDLGNCGPASTPGFEGAYALVAVAAVALLGLIGRRRRI